MIIEEWKPVVGFEHIYEVSNEGRIRTCVGKTTISIRHGIRVWRQRILKAKQAPNKRGRIDPRVTLYKGKKEFTYLVSRIVAMAWVDGYKEGMTVNHIDGNPLNNNSSNLEWVTRKKNIQLAFENLQYSTQKPCILLNRNGESKSFRSRASASLFLGHAQTYIDTCLRNNRNIKDANGNVFTYIPAV